MVYFLAIIMVMQGVTMTVTANFNSLDECTQARAEFIAALPVEGATETRVEPCVKKDAA